jgi:hypothetical protein
MRRLLYEIFTWCVGFFVIFFVVIGAFIFFDFSQTRQDQEDKNRTIKIICRDFTEIFGWGKLCDKISYPLNTRFLPGIADYKFKSFPLNYRKAMLGQIKAEQLTYFEGRVIQSIERKSFLVATREYRDRSFSGESIFIEFSSKQEILEGDIVKFYARYNGTLTYKAGLGNEVEVPKFFGDYYEMQN